MAGEKDYEIGDVVEFSLSDLNPTQPDDDKFPLTNDPLEVYQDHGEWYIQNGNHRYYRKLDEKGSECLTKAQIVKNPYFDFL